MLSLSKARKRRIYYYGAAALLLVFSHVELVIGIFWNMNHASFSRGFAYPLLTSIQNWHVWGLPVGDFLIHAAPNVASLNSYYLIVLAMIFAGWQFFGRAAELSHSMARARKKAQEQSWAWEINGHYPSAETEIRISIEQLAKDSWQARPVGIIVLSVISGLIVLVIQMVIEAARHSPH